MVKEWKKTYECGQSWCPIWAIQRLGTAKSLIPIDTAHIITMTIAFVYLEWISYIAYDEHSIIICSIIRHNQLISFLWTIWSRKTHSPKTKSSPAGHPDQSSEVAKSIAKCKRHRNLSIPSWKVSFRMKALESEGNGRLGTKDSTLPKAIYCTKHCFIGSGFFTHFTLVFP